MQVSFLDLAVCRTLLRNSEPFTYPISYTFVRSTVICALLRLCRPAGVRRPRPQCMARHPTGDQAWAGISGPWRASVSDSAPAPARTVPARDAGRAVRQGRVAATLLDQRVGSERKRGQTHFLRRQVRDEQVASEVVEAGGVVQPTPIDSMYLTDFFKSRRE